MKTFMCFSNEIKVVYQILLRNFIFSNKMLRTIDIVLTLNISCWILIPMLYFGNILNTPKHIKADKEITPNKF